MTDTGSTAGLTVAHDAAELVVGSDEGTGAVVLEDVTLAAFGDEVVAVSPTAEVSVDYLVEDAETAIDATDKTVLPGFINSHTHALSAGDRFDEFVAKLQGMTYEDILADGGGTLRTIDAVHGVSDDELAATFADHLDAMLAHGMTTVEVKIGYDPDAEIKLWMFSVIDTAGSDHLVDMVPTFTGAHAVSRGADAEEYTESVVSDQLSAVAAQGIAESCDVFCGRNVFIVEQSRRTLDVDRNHGLTLKIHADEFAVIDGTGVAASVGAVSVDHLLHADSEGRDMFVDAGVTPVLLPGTAFGLGADYADVRAFLDVGHEAALVVGFNPNCFARSMSFVATLASVGMRMTLHEAIRGVTSVATGALDRDNDAGTFRTGTPTDVVALDVPITSHLSYRFDTNPVSTVSKSGVVTRE